ncbi:MAG: hypothetical protein EBQ67_03155 [Sphingobacteriia bacterium]|nr:hypothetical protein [Sphingobacteriia bacterium]
MERLQHLIDKIFRDTTLQQGMNPMLPGKLPIIIGTQVQGYMGICQIMAQIRRMTANRTCIPLCKSVHQATIHRDRMPRQYPMFPQAVFVITPNCIAPVHGHAMENRIPPLVQIDEMSSGFMWIPSPSLVCCYRSIS